MKLVAFSRDGVPGVGVVSANGIHGRLASDSKFPGELDNLIREGEAGWSKARNLVNAPAFDANAICFRPPFTRSGKIICVGLNYSDHTVESQYEQPDYPTLFCRFTSSLVAHKAPIIRPQASEALDFEGELVAVIGVGGRHISRADALKHVAGYSIFNDASIRDFQHRTPQWTVGKNFDGTGAFGPVFVTADEIPAGARGLTIQTRLNGRVVQASNTEKLIFDVATLVSVISQAITLAPGDLVVTGTPAGVGHSRKPRLYMKPGDLVEVEIEGIGTLSNPVADEVTDIDQVA